MKGKLNLLVAYPYMQGQIQVIRENAATAVNDEDAYRASRE